MPKEWEGFFEDIVSSPRPEPVEQRNVAVDATNFSRESPWCLHDEGRKQPSGDNIGSHAREQVRIERTIPNRRVGDEIEERHHEFISSDGDTVNGSESAGYSGKGINAAKDSNEHATSGAVHWNDNMSAADQRGLNELSGRRESDIMDGIDPEQELLYAVKMSVQPSRDGEEEHHLIAQVGDD